MHAAANYPTTPGVHVQAWGQDVKNRLGSTIEVEDIAHLGDEALLPQYSD
jgi:hypothetical protein